MFSRVGKVKEVLPTDDPHTLQLVSQLTRLQFLMDKVLQGTLEEDAASAMNFMIKAESVEVVQAITCDRQLMKDLFDVLKDPSEPKHRQNDVVLFVHQLCTMAEKTMIDLYR